MTKDNGMKIMKLYKSIFNFPRQSDISLRLSDSVVFKGETVTTSHIGSFSPLFNWDYRIVDVSNNADSITPESVEGLTDSFHESLFLEYSKVLGNSTSLTISPYEAIKKAYLDVKWVRYLMGEKPMHRLLRSRLVAMRYKELRDD